MSLHRHDKLQAGIYMAMTYKHSKLLGNREQSHQRPFHSNFYVVDLSSHFHKFFLGRGERMYYVIYIKVTTKIEAMYKYKVVHKLDDEKYKEIRQLGDGGK